MGEWYDRRSVQLRDIAMGERRFGAVCFAAEYVELFHAIAGRKLYRIRFRRV